MGNKIILGSIIFIIMIIVAVVGLMAEINKRRAFDKRK